MATAGQERCLQFGTNLESLPSLLGVGSVEHKCSQLSNLQAFEIPSSVCEAEPISGRELGGWWRSWRDCVYQLVFYDANVAQLVQE